MSTVDEKNGAMIGDSRAVIEDSRTHIDSSLFRLTSGLPKRELRLIVHEAVECEALLLEDIRILEQALAGVDEENAASLDVILESPLTPLDRYWTASALLGRLRQEMALPSLMTASNGTDNNKALAEQQPLAVEESSYQELTIAMSPLAKIYSQDVIPASTLLAVWKKIWSNRAASVFKRPVRSEEAPGYTERIMFPMDLSLIRKRIVANNIQTYTDLHTALGLISHNCVKYNGGYARMNVYRP